MRENRGLTLLLCLFLAGLNGMAGVALADEERKAPVRVGVVEGAGVDIRPAFPELTDEQQREIQAAIDRNIEDLAGKGMLPTLLMTPPILGWPLAAQNGLMSFDFHGISNFVDLDPAFPNQLEDYQCGQRTYDLVSGYNHQGIDYFTWPWGWNKMDSSEVAIVAVAPGTIVFKQDGEFDRSCGFNNNPWNAVYVQHADGSVAWYGHMKSGTPTAKLVGEPVAQGEYLGVVGSSGSSTGPHLHLELHDSMGGLVEPHSGPCNAGSSWWASQRPYYDSAINDMTTGFAAVGFPACPNPETPNTAIDFAPDSDIYFTAYYRDQRNLAFDPAGATTQYRLYYPDGAQAASWSHSSDAPHYAASYWYFIFYFPPGIDTGIWRWEATYQGVSYDHYFSVGGPFPSGSVSGNPMTVTLEAGGDVTLDWDPSCSPGDTDYSIYEGTLGDYYSHENRFCTTDGLTTKTFTPAPGDTYYLVVPNNKVWEGSFGKDSSGAERPSPTFSCLPQLVGSCP